MKIQQSCNEKPTSPLPSSLPAGTVFKLSGFTTLYLKLMTGFASLSDNKFIEVNNFANYTVDIIYPNAKVVLE